MASVASRVRHSSICPSPCGPVAPAGPGPVAPTVWPKPCGPVQACGPGPHLEHALVGGAVRLLALKVVGGLLVVLHRLVKVRHLGGQGVRCQVSDVR